MSFRREKTLDFNSFQMAFNQDINKWNISKEIIRKYKIKKIYRT